MVRTVIAVLLAGCVAMPAFAGPSCGSCETCKTTDIQSVGTDAAPAESEMAAPKADAAKTIAMPGKKIQKGTLHRLTGRVKAINTDAPAITVANKRHKKNITFPVPKKAKVRRGKKVVGFDNIKVGDPVKVFFKGSLQDPKVQRISIPGPKKAKAMQHKKMMHKKMMHKKMMHKKMMHKKKRMKRGM